MTHGSPFHRKARILVVVSMGLLGGGLLLHDFVSTTSLSAQTGLSTAPVATITQEEQITYQAREARVRVRVPHGTHPGNPNTPPRLLVRLTASSTDANTPLETSITQDLNLPNQPQLTSMRCYPVRGNPHQSLCAFYSPWSYLGQSETSFIVKVGLPADYCYGPALSLRAEIIWPSVNGAPPAFSNTSQSINLPCRPLDRDLSVTVTTHPTSLVFQGSGEQPFDFQASTVVPSPYFGQAVFKHRFEGIPVNQVRLTYAGNSECQSVDPSRPTYVRCQINPILAASMICSRDTATDGITYCTPATNNDFNQRARFRYSIRPPCTSITSISEVVLEGDTNPGNNVVRRVIPCVTAVASSASSAPAATPWTPARGRVTLSPGVVFSDVVRIKQITAVPTGNTGSYRTNFILTLGGIPRSAVVWTGDPACSLEQGVGDLRMYCSYNMMSVGAERDVSVGFRVVSASDSTAREITYTLSSVDSYVSLLSTQRPLIEWPRPFVGGSCAGTMPPNCEGPDANHNAFAFCCPALPNALVRCWDPDQSGVLKRAPQVASVMEVEKPSFFARLLGSIVSFFRSEYNLPSGDSLVAQTSGTSCRRRIRCTSFASINGLNLQNLTYNGNGSYQGCNLLRQNWRIFSDGRQQSMGSCSLQQTRTTYLRGDALARQIAQLLNEPNWYSLTTMISSSPLGGAFSIIRGHDGVTIADVGGYEQLFRCLAEDYDCPPPPQQPQPLPQPQPSPTPSPLPSPSPLPPTTTCTRIACSSFYNSNGIALRGAYFQPTPAEPTYIACSNYGIRYRVEPYSGFTYDNQGRKIITASTQWRAITSGTCTPSVTTTPVNAALANQIAQLLGSPLTQPPSMTLDGNPLSLEQGAAIGFSLYGSFAGHNARVTLATSHGLLSCGSESYSCAASSPASSASSFSSAPSSIASSAAASVEPVTICDSIIPPNCPLTHGLVCCPNRTWECWNPAIQCPNVCGDEATTSSAVSSVSSLSSAHTSSSLLSSIASSSSSPALASSSLASSRISSTFSSSSSTFSSASSARSSFSSAASSLASSATSSTRPFVLTPQGSIEPTILAGPAVELRPNTAGVTLFKGQVWLAGGLRNINQGYSNEVYRLNTDAWELMGTVPLATQSPILAEYNGELWYMGGYAPGGYSDRTFHSADGITWTEGPRLTQAVSSGEAVSFNGKLYLFSSSKWQSFDGTAWRNMGANLYARGLAVFSDSIWYLGNDGYLMRSTNATTFQNIGQFPYTGRLQRWDRAAYSMFAHQGYLWVVVNHTPPEATVLNPICLVKVMRSRDGYNWDEYTLPQCTAIFRNRSVVATGADRVTVVGDLFDAGRTLQWQLP